MDNFDVPIFKKTYELYKAFFVLRATAPKKDRYTIWQKCENNMLEILELIISASHKQKSEKGPVLERASLKLDVLRILIRLMKDIKSIDNKKYIAIETSIDEIGRMLGGWIRSNTIK